jgi:hypothetical protein
LPFTPRSKRCLQIAADAAAPDLVHVAHLAIAVVSRTDTVAGEVLELLGVAIPKLRAQLERNAAA